MRINIEHFTEAELVDLNQRIIHRLRTLRDVRAQGAMRKFNIGDRVTFNTDQGALTGMLTKYNQKSVTVITDDGRKWNVSPALLKHALEMHVTAEGKIVEVKRAKE